MKNKSTLSSIIISALLLLFVVSVSGCIQIGQQEETKYGNGVIVDSFEAFPTSVYSGDEFDLTMYVENKGGREATNVYACLYSPSPRGRSLRRIGSLEPATKELEGDIGSADWTVKAPQVPQGITTKITARSRLFYEYETVASNMLEILSEEEAKVRQQRDEEMPSQQPTTVSHGPFSLEIETRSKPIESGDKEVRLYITGNNLMDGTPFTTGSSTFDIGDFFRDFRDLFGSLDSQCSVDTDVTNQVYMKIKADGARLKGDCRINNYGKGAEVDVRNGQEFRETCTLEVDSVKPQQTIPITVQLKYGYFLSTSRDITVEGEE